MFKNERGSISATLILIALICSSIYYFIQTTDSVDDEVRSLGFTQQLSYLRADVAGTVQGWMEGFPNPDCPSSLKTVSRDKFSKFSSPGAHSDNFSSSSDSTDIKLSSLTTGGSNAFLFCYFHPKRYSSFALRKFSASFSVNGAPNYQSLSQDVVVRVEMSLRARGMSFPEKYNFSFRMRVASLKDYGVVWTVDGNSAPLFTATSDQAKVNVYGQSLVIKRDSSSPFTANRLLTLSGPVSSPATRPLYAAPIHLNFPVMAIDNNSLSFIQDNGIEKIFQKGILPEAIRSFDFPTEHGTAWNEVFNVPASKTSAGMPLPFTTSRVTTRSGRVANKIDGGDPAATAVPMSHSYFNSSFDMMPKDAGDSSVSIPVESCKVSSGSPRLPIYANANSAGGGGGDFTIDLSKSKTLDNPPIFCGLISANKIIIKLNDEANSSDYHQHYVIGKFYVTSQFVIEGRGSLNILDISSFESDDILITTASDKKPDASTLRSNFNAFSNLSYRNFLLPILKAGQSYGALPTPAAPGEITWVQPMSISEWLFSDNLTCPAGQWCYKEPLAPKPAAGGAGSLTVYPRIDNALPYLYFRAEPVL